MARTFPFKYKEFYSSSTCIYKATFGTKFYIVKAKALRQSVDQVMEDIDRKMRLGVPDGHILQKVIKHIISARVPSCTIEVLFKSDDHGELIYNESEILKQAELDPKCLNTSFVPYLPKWISQLQVERYKPEPVKKLQKQKAKPAAIKQVKEKPATKVVYEPIDDSGLIFNFDAVSSALDKINAAKDLKTGN